MCQVSCLFLKTVPWILQSSGITIKEVIRGSYIQHCSEAGVLEQRLDFYSRGPGKALWDDCLCCNYSSAVVVQKQLWSVHKRRDIAVYSNEMSFTKVDAGQLWPIGPQTAEPNLLHPKFSHF